MDQNQDHNRELIDTIAQLHKDRYDSTCALMLKLLSLCIDEKRLENDNIPKDLLEFNQGEIRAYMKLKQYIEIGIPTEDLMRRPKLKTELGGY